MELREAAEDVYTYAKIAVNQIICLGGKEPCQPCQNREALAESLEILREILDR